MSSALRFFRGLNSLLIFLPISLVLHTHHGVNPLWIFVTAALAIIPLAGLMGKATEELAAHLGAAWGGLLNATFGNATELIIGILALQNGLTELVKASIVGSILGNVLLVLGASILAGGMRFKVQTFNQEQAESQSISLLLAALSLSIPAIFATTFHHTHSARDPDNLKLSLWVSGILLLVYVASLLFALKTHRNVFRACDEAEELEEAEPPTWSKRRALFVLAAATALVAAASEVLVGSVEGAARSMGVNQTFIGIIVVAVIGNAAEHSTAVMMALKDKMDISINIALGSSIQIAMFVAPLLVIAGHFMHSPMTYIFSGAELAAITFSVVIAAFIAGDGKCHWLEGAQLLAAYFLIAVAFYYLP